MSIYSLGFIKESVGFVEHESCSTTSPETGIFKFRLRKILLADHHLCLKIGPIGHVDLGIMEASKNHHLHMSEIERQRPWVLQTMWVNELFLVG